MIYSRQGTAERKEKSWSISRVLSWTVIHLGLPSLTTSSNLPESSAGHANGFLFGLAPDGVCLATDCYQPCGALLPHLFTLTGACALRRLFSVALSIGLRLPGVTWRLALWSPDFPLPCMQGSDCLTSSAARVRLLQRLRKRQQRRQTNKYAIMHQMRLTFFW